MGSEGQGGKGMVRKYSSAKGVKGSEARGKGMGKEVDQGERREVRQGGR